MFTQEPSSPQIVLHHAARGEWLAFQQPVSVLQAGRGAEVLPLLRRAQEAVEEQGLWAAGFIAYEAAPAFDAALHVQGMPVQTADDLPLVWFGLFPPPQPVALPAPAQGEVGLNGWQPSVSRETYHAAIQRIKAHIAQGNTYQVNYTMRLRSPFHGDAWELFLRLAEAQQAQYAAYLDTGRFAICSASPELFFCLDGERLVSKPMKGTAGRGLTLAGDQAQAEWLHNSEKNRAENVMIVDMIRNDMGRVARSGSVQVPRLFDVERYPTVWQMTSTVESRTDAPFVEVMAALFPCASITGAPKPRTMQIIADLEGGPRRIYTGCIGFYAPQRQAQFNVAIRTVLIDRQLEQAEYGVGGGIVWDSTSADEYDECMVKARVLTEPRPQFELLESLLWTAQDGYFLLDGHLRRLSESAQYFGFFYDAHQAQARLEDLAGDLAAGAYKVRLLLSKQGKITCSAAPIELAARAKPVRLGLAAQPVNSRDVFLYHKTTWRKVYDDAQAACLGCDDVLLWNECEEITETCVGNLVAQIGDQLFTPPVECGLLPGVFRAHLLERGVVQERRLSKEEVFSCERLYVINSVRGMRDAFF